MSVPTQVTRSAWSCESCRRRKVKCDSGDPCSHCRRRNEPCIWPDNAKHVTRSPEDHGSTPQAASGLVARLARVEAALEQAGILDPLPQIPQGQRSSHVSPGEQALGLKQNINFQHITDASPGGPLQEDVHRHDDFDHHIIGGSPEQSRDNPQDALGQNKQSEDMARIKALDILSRTLPERHLCDQLVRSYFRHVEWIHHTLNVPAFMADYELFWQQYRAGRSLPDLQWLSLLMIILCLGSHFDPDVPAADAEEDLYAATNAFLRLSNYLQSHSINVVQTLMLMGLWLNDRGLSNTHHAQLALAIKMAVNMGLSKMDAGTGYPGAFPSEDTAFFSVSRPIPKCNRAGEREIRRRLWWSLVCQDYYTSSSCNFSYTVQPKQCKTHLFLNLDEDDLAEDILGLGTSDQNPVDGFPLHETATTASYHLLKIPFTHVAKAMVDLYNDDDFSYSSVLKLDTLLWETYEKLPSFFKWRSIQDLMPIPASRAIHLEHLEWQRLFLGFTVHNRVLRLHRPFMVRGYVDSSMEYSKSSTLNSALACLELAEHGHRINFPGLRWWVILIHIFTSGVALCIDFHFLLITNNHGYTRRSPNDAELRSLIELRREQIGRIIKLLRPAARSSIAAARAILAIDGLVEQAQKSSPNSMPSITQAGPSKKRKRAETGNDPNSNHEGLIQPPSVTSSGVDNQESAVGDIWQGEFNLEDWNGPDWDQLFASLAGPNDNPNEEMNGDLFEAMNSFMAGF